MSELLPYEEILKQRLADLPLPDENFAWQEMRKLLDEDDDDPVIVPPIRWGCLLLALIAIGIAWWLLRPEKWFISGRGETTTNDTSIAKQEKKISTDNYSLPEPLIKIDSKATISDKGVDTLVQSFKKAEQEKLTIELKEMLKPGSNSHIPEKNNPRKATNRNEPAVISNKDNRKPPTARIVSERMMNSTKNESTIQAPGVEAEKINGNNDTMTRERNVRSTIPESIRSQSRPVDSVKGDSLREIISKPPIDPTGSDTMKVTSEPKDSISNLIPPTDSTKPKKQEIITHSWSAGLALNHQIPFDGQTATPFGSQGRELSLRDYIPAAYIRFNRDNKWFVQGELRYGAPQHVRDIVYDVKTNTGPGGFNTRQILKKTYYHQLPIGFHYYVLPGLSAGAGFVWNRFSSVVSQEEIYTGSPTQRDSILSTSIVRVRTRQKALAKSFLQAFGEVQYTYKKFTLGGRYSRGIQPYLKFQLPGEQEKRERNSSLQVFFRYQLWQSKKK